jgi:hypothetical protein
LRRLGRSLWSNYELCFYLGYGLSGGGRKGPCDSAVRGQQIAVPEGHIPSHDDTGETRSFGASALVIDEDERAVARAAGVENTPSHDNELSRPCCNVAHRRVVSNRLQQFELLRRFG